MNRIRDYYREAVAASGRRLVFGVLAAEIALAVIEAVGLGLLAPLGKVVIDGAQTIGFLGRVEPVDAVVFAGVLLVVRTILQWGTTTWGARLRLRTAEHLRLSTVEAVMSAEWSYVVGQRRSAVVQALTTQSDRAESAISALIQAATVGLVAVATLVAGVVVQPVLGLLVVVVLVVGGLVSRVGLRRARRMGEEWGVLTAAFSNLATDALGSLRIARAHGAERAWLGAIEESAAATRSMFLRYVRTAANSHALLTLGGFVVAGAMVEIGKSLDVAGPTLVGLAVLAFRGIGSAQSFVQSASHFVTYAPAIDHLRSIRAEAATHPHVDEARRGTSGAELETLDLGMVIDGQTIFEGLCLTVPRRGVVAIVGRSGAGKTTALDICVGLLSQTTGSVMMRAGEEPWRSRLAYVPQHPVLLPTSVRENLTWSAGRDVADDEIWSVLSDLEIAAAVRRLPGGLDAYLGDSGTLSGGEQQRLCLGRALLRHPSLLILDEPTAGLDVKSERVIIEALRAFRGAVLVATHSAAVVEAADAVVNLVRD